MKTAPTILEIKSWLIKENPLKLFRDGKFSIKDIDPKPWSGHFNYLITAGGRKLVLRFKGPEWGATKGIIDEYKILKFAEKYNVGPMAYYLDEHFFGEAVMLEEYFDGRPFNLLPDKNRKNLYPKIARFIAKINQIPIDKKTVPFWRAMTSYKNYKKTWRDRLKIILSDSRMRESGREIRNMLLKAEKMLDRFEPSLKRVLRDNGPSFIFESAHAGHLIVTKKGFRFLNWERASYGDPSYTLAVFLSSISKEKDFEKIKLEMISEYLKINSIYEFENLVEQRLKEREISNKIWVLWAQVRREKDILH